MIRFAQVFSRKLKSFLGVDFSFLDDSEIFGWLEIYRGYAFYFGDVGLKFFKEMQVFSCGFDFSNRNYKDHSKNTHLFYKKVIG